MDELEAGVNFHGHLCPMFYLGFRMGRLSLKKLNRRRERGVRFHAVVEFPNCFGDGIQFITGATFGKNNLHLKNTGKFAGSFYDLVSGNNIRLKMKEDVVKRVLEYGKSGKKVKKLPPADRDEESNKLMRRGKEIVGWLKELGDEELFEEELALDFIAEEGPSFDYVFCENCGELTLREYSDAVGEKQVCRDCDPIQ
jgi:formylmethanofuran dehydrogenase subunit E